MQLVSIMILIGIASTPNSPFMTKVSFIDTGNIVLYVTAVLSIFTIVRASVNEIKTSFNGFLSAKGALLYGLFLLISLVSRLFAIFLYFSPSLELLPILWHMKMGRIRFTDFRLEGSTPRMELKKSWKTFYSSRDYPITLLIAISFYFIQIGLMFIVKCWRKGKTNALAQGLDSVISPLNGGVFSIITFTLGNMLLMIPMFNLRHAITK